MSSSSRRDSGRDGQPLDCKVYVGELGTSGDKRELEDAFGYYGPLKNVWVARSPPGFAFVEFEDPRDARDAARALDGRTICGRRVRVELSTGKSRHSGRDGGGRDSGRDGGGSRYSGGGGGGGRGVTGGRPFNPADRCYDCGERGHYARACREARRRTRSRSRSRGRYSRSRSRSPRDDYSRSRSRSRSRGRSRSASKSPRPNGASAD